jgi:uncharacterized membrane protein YqhA
VNRAIGAARWLALIGVLFGLLAAASAFTWGAAQTLEALRQLGHGELEAMGVNLVRVMESFLIASGLMIFSLGLYELFIGSLALPAWLVVKDMGSLEGKLAGIVVLALAVAFLERIDRGAEARDALYLGLGVSPVAVVLILLFRRG